MQHDNKKRIVSNAEVIRESFSPLSPGPETGFAEVWAGVRHSTAPRFPPRVCSKAMIRGLDSRLGRGSFSLFFVQIATTTKYPLRIASPMSRRRSARASSCRTQDGSHDQRRRCGRHSPSSFLNDNRQSATSNCGFPAFGTRSVQLSERKRGTLLPKRHQIKHLEFVPS